MKALFLVGCTLSMALLTLAQDKPSKVDILHYDHSLSLSYDDKSIDGSTTVRFAKSDADLLVLNLATIDTSDVLGMTVQSVVLQGGENLAFVHEKNLLRIALPSSLQDTSEIHIVYSGTPADGLIIGKNKFGDRTWFGDNWPNRAQHWLPVIDHPSEKATVNFEVTAPSDLKVIANGVLKDTTSEKEMRTWRYECQYPIPTKVMVIGVAPFRVKHYADTSITKVSAWVYPQNDNNGFYDYALAVPIVSFFDSLIAPFPYDKLANVQSTTRYGGMENAGCIFYSESSIDGKRSSEALIAHEVAHQWYGNTASECDWPHVWLSEGFATYLTEVYFETTQGEEMFRTRWSNVRKRVEKFYKLRPQGVILDSTYTNLNWHLSPLTYQRAAMMLHTFRKQVGDSLFFEGIRIYYGNHKYANACTEDFIAVFNALTEKDWMPFFTTYLTTPEIPTITFKLKAKSNGVQLKKLVTNNWPATGLWVPLTLTLENAEEVTKLVFITSEIDAVKVTTDQGKVRQASVDKYGEILISVN